MSPAEVMIGISIGLVAGAAAGLFGVGGGFVMVPAMVVAFQTDHQVAIGTSLLVIVVTALVGTRANLQRGLVEVPAVPWLGAGGIVGAILGAMLTLEVLQETTVRWLFAAILVVIALRMLLQRPPEDGPETGT